MHQDNAPRQCTALPIQACSACVSANVILYTHNATTKYSRCKFPPIQLYWYQANSLPLTTIRHLVQLCSGFSPFIAVDILLTPRIRKVRQSQRFMLQQQSGFAVLTNMRRPCRGSGPALSFVPSAHLLQTPVHELNQSI